MALLKSIKHREYVDIGGPLNGVGSLAPAATPTAASLVEDAVDDLSVSGDQAPAEQPPFRPDEPERRRRPNKLFVGRGRTKSPLEQLTSILRDLGIPYLVAEDEANVGRPISQKVRHTTNQCGAAIFIFSADVEHLDPCSRPLR